MPVSFHEKRLLRQTSIYGKELVRQTYIYVHEKRDLQNRRIYINVWKEICIYVFSNRFSIEMYTYGKRPNTKCEGRCSAMPLGEQRTRARENEREREKKGTRD